MTVNDSSTTSISQAIEILKEEIRINPNSDLLSKITLASLLEKSNKNSEAKTIYQAVIDQDREGLYGSIARRALENLAFIDNINLEKKLNHISCHNFSKFGSNWHGLKWKGLSSYSKLAIFSIVTISLPFIIATQTLVSSVNYSALQELKEAPSFNNQRLIAVEKKLKKQQVYIYALLGIILILIYLLIIKFANYFTRLLKYIAIFAQAMELGDNVIMNDTYLQRQDEIGAVARNLKAIADLTEITLRTLHQEQRLRLQENQVFQNAIIDLLIETQSVVDGDLTARVTVKNGITSSIADAINVVISNLQELVLRVQIATKRVSASAVYSQDYMLNLDQAAATQIEIVQEVLNSVKLIEKSIQSIVEVSQTVTETVNRSLASATKGVSAMDTTVNAVDLLRTSIAETLLKTKQFAESSQEIFRIVDTISTISKQTNMLSINARLEAVKAGESGESINLVAEDIERLSRQIARATKEIEQIVTTVQQGISDVQGNMEVNSKQVEIGTRMLTETKLNFVELVDNSEIVNSLLQSVFKETKKQAIESQTLSANVNFVVEIAEAALSGSTKTMQSIKKLLDETEQLQNSVSKFKTECPVQIDEYIILE